MELTNCIKSKVDATEKYIFNLKGQEVELSYIQKNDGKDIIICPTQTSCKMGCTFCFLTGMNLPVVNLTAEDMCSGVNQVIKEAGLPHSETLLVSFMGSGEPLLNYKSTIRACKELCHLGLRALGGKAPYFHTVRFAVATMIPSSQLMREFTEAARTLPIKLHLSLHSPFDDVRNRMMPAAEKVKPSLDLLRDYYCITKNPIEIHYTLIDGVNDREEDKQALLELLDADTPIKFLDFKVRCDSDRRGSSRVGYFRGALEAAGVPTEFYAPPGPDIGSSCGQFVRTMASPAGARADDE